MKLVICEPFVLKAGKVNDKWFPGYDGYRAAAKRVADESGAVFVPFQTMFDAASKIAPPALWAADGDPSDGRRRGHHGEPVAQSGWARSIAINAATSGLDIAENS